MGVTVSSSHFHEALRRDRCDLAGSGAWKKATLTSHLANESVMLTGRVGAGRNQ